jgi:hypothetical protein
LTFFSPSAALNPSSIVYIELRFLYQYLVQELLTALVVMHEDAIAVNPTNIQVSHKAAGPYERLYKQLFDDCNNIASIPADLPKRLLEVTKIGVILRPTDSVYWQNLANSHLGTSVTPRIAYNVKFRVQKVGRVGTRRKTGLGEWGESLNPKTCELVALLTESSPLKSGSPDYVYCCQRPSTFSGHF